MDHNPLQEIDSLARLLSIPARNVRHTVLERVMDYAAVSREDSLNYDVDDASCLVLTHAQFTSVPGNGAGSYLYDLRSDSIYYEGLTVGISDGGALVPLSLDPSVLRAPFLIVFPPSSRVGIKTHYVAQADATPLRVIMRFSGYQLPADTLQALRPMSTFFFQLVDQEL